MLAMLIQKDGLAHVACANHAKAANHGGKKACSLAPIATLALAASQNSFDNAPPEHYDFEERAAIIEADGVPRDWAEGFAQLCTMPRPSAYTQKRWEQILNDGGLFLDQWKTQVIALGWRPADVFGVCPDAPAWRYDRMGLVPLLEGRRVFAITSNAARIACNGGEALTFFRNTMDAHAVALWELRAK